MTDDYPDSDFPYTLFFQGVAMPQWANCWGFVKLPESSADWFVDRIWGRIDHVGIVESEEAGIFTIAAQQVLCAMLESPDDCLQYEETAEGAPRLRTPVYAGIIGGLRQMIELAESEEVVFWTSGYVRDADRLREALGKYRAGELTPPHRIKGRQEIEQQIWTQRRELRRLAQSGRAEKEIRRFIHALPQRA
jgi:hypothetical protein